jgi:hypothetical protein
MRKRWTPQEEVTESLIKIREKRKWQIALRRYIIDKMPCPLYAPYFGLDITSFRKWIELQFKEGLSWDTFAKSWQFDHIVPITYFDFSKEEELRLAWNFINIRVEPIKLNKNRGNRVDVIAAKGYFEDIYIKTDYTISKKMIQKIEAIELSQIVSNEKLEDFIIENRQFIETISSFSHYQYEQLNVGISLDEVIGQRKLLEIFEKKN